MATYRIRHCEQLRGEVSIHSAKNAVLPLMCACLLTREPLVIEHVPHLTDVQTLLDILADCGVSMRRDGDTLTLWDSTDITFNFSNVSLASQYDANETYYLVSADAINVLKDSSGLHLSGRTVSLGSGYYGKLDIITGKDKREYLAMNVVGDPRRTWSGMLANDYIWKHTEDKNDTPNALW